MAIGEPTSVVVATPGGNPVMALPGDKQIAPVMTVKPEFVIVEEALTPQSFEFAPRDILADERTEELVFEGLSTAVIGFLGL